MQDGLGLMQRVTTVPTQVAALSSQHPVMSGGTDLVLAAIAAVTPAPLASARLHRGLEMVAALGVFDTQVAHHRSPLRPVWSRPWMQRPGDYVCYLMGYGLVDEGIRLQLCQGQVVTDTCRSRVRPDHLACRLAAQIAVHTQGRQGSGLTPQQGRRPVQTGLGGLLDALLQAQEACSRAMAR